LRFILIYAKNLNPNSLVRTKNASLYESRIETQPNRESLVVTHNYHRAYHIFGIYLCFAIKGILPNCHAVVRIFNPKYTTVQRKLRRDLEAGYEKFRFSIIFQTPFIISTKRLGVFLFFIWSNYSLHFCRWRMCRK
jgi:hypothetical protein